MSFAFTDDERAFLSRIRHAIVKDAQGREVLAGLTVEETEFYMGYVRQQQGESIPEPEATQKYLDLHSKHEHARLAVIAAEAELSNLNPPRH